MRPEVPKVDLLTARPLSCVSRVCGSLGNSTASVVHAVERPGLSSAKLRNGPSKLRSVATTE